MRHTMAALALCSGIIALGAPAIAAVSDDTMTVNNRILVIADDGTRQELTITVTPAGGCTKAQKTLESRMGVNCSIWRAWFNTKGELIGGDFHTNKNIRVNGPMKGYFTDACEGQLWSTSNHHRWTMTDAGSYHVNNSGRHTLCTTPNSKSAALKRLVSSGPATASRATPVLNSSTGWKIKANGSVSLKKVYHGTVTTPRGTYTVGQKPDNLSAGEQATFWYNG